MRGLIYNLELQKGEVLGYATHCLASLRPDFDRIWVVTNGAPDSDGLAELNACSDEVVVLERIWLFTEHQRSTFPNKPF